MTAEPHLDPEGDGDVAQPPGDHPEQVEPYWPQVVDHSGPWLRLAIWFVSLLLMLSTLLQVFGAAIGMGLSQPVYVEGQPSVWEEHPGFIVALVTFYLLGLVPLFWPGASKGLRIFGVVLLLMGLLIATGAYVG